MEHKTKNKNFNFKTIKLLLLVPCLLFLASPLIADAQSYLPIVQCGNSVNPNPCTTCDFFKMVKNMIDLGLYVITPVAATLFFIWAGFLMLISAGNPGSYASAKKIFSNAVIGVIIVLTAWLVANTFIQVLGPSNIQGNWWQWQCPAGLP